MTGFQLLLQDLLHRHGIDTTEQGIAKELQTLLCKNGYDFPYEVVEAHVIGTDRCPDQGLALALIDVFGLDEAGIHEFSRMIVFGQRPVGQLSDALRSSSRVGKARALSQPPRQGASPHRA